MWQQKHMWKCLYAEGSKMCFAENKILVIVTVYLLVNSAVQMICWKLQTEHKSFDTPAEKTKEMQSEYLGFVLLR